MFCCNFILMVVVEIECIGYLVVCLVMLGLVVMFVCGYVIV